MKRGSHYLRKKISAEKRRYNNKFKELLDKAVLIIAFLAPLIELPQLIEIYTKKSAENVSVITWSLFVVFGIPWLIYGIMHKEKPIIILYTLWIIVDAAIVSGILLYG